MSKPLTKSFSGMFWILIVACAYPYSVVAGVQALDWDALPDKDAQVFDDPYRDLEPAQLVKLISVAQLRQLAEKGESIDKEKLARETDALVADGIDIDAILAQRWEVAEKRKLAASSGNSEVDGRDIQIAGFVIPAPADADGSVTAYLVPERGMCSHMPPPQPNQMLKLTLPDTWQPHSLYEPVVVSGRLAIAPNSRTIRVVDGLVPMRATFSLDVSDVTSMRESADNRGN
ncbi:MAG: DUF3299 domain-containing protein [Chromatiales bacterium]